MKGLFKKVGLCLLTCLVLTGCKDDDPMAEIKHISTPEDLLRLEEGGSFVLDNDIDCGGKGLRAFGVDSKAGVKIDGQGHKIENLYIVSSDYNCAGLIAYSEGEVEMKNISLNIETYPENYRPDNNSKFIGIAVGLCNSTVTLDNVELRGKINGNTGNADESYFGAAVGWALTTNFNNVYNEVDIVVDLDGVSSGKMSRVSGLIGFSRRTVTLNNIINTPSIEVKHFSGGGGKVKVASICGGADPLTGKNVITAPKHFLVPQDYYTVDYSLAGITTSRDITRTYFVSDMQPDFVKTYYGHYESDNYTEIHMSIHDILTSEVMFDRYTNDYLGEEEKMFCEFDPNIWYANSMSEEVTNVGLKLFK